MGTHQLFGFLSVFLLLPSFLSALSSCRDGPCETLKTSAGGGRCRPSGSITCLGGTFSTYNCSPPVIASTRAILTPNDFLDSKCNITFTTFERVVALSTGWYAGGSRCGKLIRIRAKNGKTTTAKVVEECDSSHAFTAQGACRVPCPNNLMDASYYVWYALNLNTDFGDQHITWSMA